MRKKSGEMRYIRAAAMLLFGLLLFFSIAGRLCSGRPDRETGGGNIRQMQTVILDPGHGGADGGAVGVNGTAEKEINLAVSLYLRDLLRWQGFTVYMTRERDEMTCDPGLTGIARQKKSDIRNRLKLMEEHPEAVVLSIHQNYFEQARYHGAQMFYGKNHPESRGLAEALQSSFVRLLQPENRREVKQGEKNVFLVWRAENPMVLVECGFLSNPEECRKLCTEEYQRQAAFVIFGGLMDWMAAQKNPDTAETVSGGEALF